MKKLIFIFICINLSYSIKIYAQFGNIPTLSIENDSSYFVLDTTQFEVLEEEKKSLSFEEVIKSKSFHVFEKSKLKNKKLQAYWIRLKVKNNLSKDLNTFFLVNWNNFFDVYVKSDSSDWRHFKTGYLLPRSKIDGKYGIRDRYRIPLTLKSNQKIEIYARVEVMFWNGYIKNVIPYIQMEDYVIKEIYKTQSSDEFWTSIFLDGLMVGVLLLAFFYNLYMSWALKNKTYLSFALCLLFFMFSRHTNMFLETLFKEVPLYFDFFSKFFFLLYFFFFVQFIRDFLKAAMVQEKLNFWLSIFLGLFVISYLLIYLVNTDWGMNPYLDFANETIIRACYVLLLIINYKVWRSGSLNARFSLIASIPLFIVWTITYLRGFLYVFLQIDSASDFWDIIPYLENACFAWLVILFSGALIARFNDTKKRLVAETLEKKKLLENQNELLEKQVEQRTAELNISIQKLKAAQNQLIQSEKLASLGELTAGIAHEIQNPLNFVNNFSEVSAELVIEMNNELENGEVKVAKEISNDLKQNLEKINHHGKRASSIVKAMLEHSRTSTGQKETTDINALVDEFLRLSYHGLRAKDKTFNADFNADLQPDLPSIEAVPQDIGRVFLNLINNAFYACSERAKNNPGEGYKPLVTVSTKALPGIVEITVKDNGSGISEENLEKIFQPFFTTKPTGKGTGLGLSLAYDIITKGHGGSIEVRSTEGVGTTFVIILPSK